MRFTILFALSAVALTACQNSSTSNVPPENNAKTPQTASKEIQTAVFLKTTFAPPYDLMKQAKVGYVLTYQIRKKGLARAGIYRIYNCVPNTAECANKYTTFSVTCDDRLNCKAYDENQNMLGTSDSSVYTFTHLYSPDPDFKNSKGGIDVYLVDPRMMSPNGAFFDQYLAADFEDEAGSKTNSVVFHLKN